MTEDIEQRTPEWFLARAGKVTASRVADIMAKTKTGTSASRATYMAELMSERLTGKPALKFSSRAMDWGTEYEEEARANYEVASGNLVEGVGFVPHPTLEAGASPDGYIGSDGLIEIKCPNTSTHLDTLMSQEIPPKYVYQIFWQMECTGRTWCDFVSYDPRLPENLRIFIKRIERDDLRLSEIRKDVALFIDELNAKIEKLNNLFQ
jgi:putative phage-type endonuclease